MPDPVHSAAPSPRALILAAGVGKRLRGVGDRPKCLLEFGGATLLARHLALLRGQGIDNITVVIGHQAPLVRQAAGPDITCILNPDYQSGSVISLLAGAPVLCAGAPVVLMDADVIYDRRLLERLLAGTAPNRLLLDREIEPGDEPVKLCIAGDRIVDFHKRPRHAHDWHGESVGFFFFEPDAAADLATRAAAYVDAGQGHLEYEEPVRDMILATPERFGYEDVSGLPWTEIDFAADVAKAQGLFSTLVC